MCVNKLSALRPSCFLCVCIFKGGVGGLLLLDSVVLSLLLQQETGAVIIRSQGTIRGKVTIAQASNSLMSIRNHWICSPPLMCLKLPKTTVEQTKPRHKSI